MAFEPIKRAWSALKQHRKTRKAARRARRKQKEADMKVLAAQLKRADDMKRIKSPKSSADYVLRHFYEADKNGKCARKHCPACGTPFFMQVAEKAAADGKTDAKTDAIDATPAASTIPSETPALEGTTNPSPTAPSRASNSSGSSSGSASPDDSVTVIPVSTTASVQDSKPADSPTPPTMGALPAATTKAAAGRIAPALMTPTVTVMQATCVSAPTPEQLAAIAAASTAKLAKHPVTWLSNLPLALSGRKADKASSNKAAGALPGSPTSPGSPLIPASSGTPAADDSTGNAAADSKAQDKESNESKALKYADKQEAAKDKQETAEAAKSEAAKSETAKSMAPKSETAKTEAADGADAVVVSPRHSSAGMGQALRRVDAWAGDVLRMMIDDKVLPKLKSSRSASVSMWSKAAKALSAPFRRVNKAAVLANVRAY